MNSDDKTKKANFMSVANYQHLMRVLIQYAQEKTLDPSKYGIRLDRLVYKTMDDIDNDNPEYDAFQKNKMTVEVVAAFLNNVINTVRSEFDSLIPPTSTCYNNQPILDAPIADIDRQISALEKSRADVDIGDPFGDFTDALKQSLDKYGTTANALRPDFEGVRSAIGNACDDPNDPGRLQTDDKPGADGTGNIPGTGQSDQGPKRRVSRYLLVNGYDRDFFSYPSRYDFNVNLLPTDSDFKDVRSIEATRLILPKEIFQERTTTNVPKNHFEYPYGLPYPYLILRVFDFQNVYKGTNVPSKSAFTHFIYDSDYSSPYTNGRGYIQMTPMQNEILTFEMSPLTRLSHMNVAILKPNGELYNPSKDESLVLRLDWNNQVNTNQQLIMVTLTKYFDRNNFYTGDMVRFTDFEIEDSTTIISEFINRPEGHQIIEYGSPNIDGYVNSFYIQAPGELNQTTGLFDINTGAVTELMDYINSIDYENDPPASVAKVINSTLQISISFRVVVEEDDITI
ncbi:hypothetical protein TetV_435 [Tetraselmis virus 1]|uniref:Uncharacterized protein n=1 Tax=Tetraselmis virus 1 TaxID=2060617 RepID=A0A2P0VNP6_9VIRU|nr:hypothetical protein QJ968_gp619 [Tetraselmis virus 1]AUF82517.1 hypothetical protein TetV_435 [Tetraselmis virus 1]